MLNWKLSNLEQYKKLEDFSKALNLQPNSLCVKIGDFGFARLLSPTNEDNQSYGSPLYMAPEVLSARNF